MKFEATREFAKSLDLSDPLKSFRERFHFPKRPAPHSGDALYLVGHSLGLQPKTTREAVLQELDDWAKLGVLGHFEAKNPWLPYHEFVTPHLCEITGARPTEVVAMNTLSVNIHAVLSSFYRPKGTRVKILIEDQAFSSDRYACQSQIKLHGLDPKDCLLEIAPRPGEVLIRLEDLLDLIEREKNTLAVVFLGNPQFLTGQVFPMKTIAKKAHSVGAFCGFDLAHGIGNLKLSLHDDEVDFAVWCSYKYLNSGPGAIGGAFIHETHALNPDRFRFQGWWGHNKKERFQMAHDFEAIPGVESWQLSNPPIFQLAALKASLQVFHDAGGMGPLEEKRKLLNQYFDLLIAGKSLKFTRITPEALDERGAQISFRFEPNAKSLVQKLEHEGVYCDFREPNIIRFAATPLYNRFTDLFDLVEHLKNAK